MKNGYSEQCPTESNKDSSSNDEEDDEDEERALEHAFNLAAPSGHHYIVGAKSLNYVMQ